MCWKEFQFDSNTERRSRSQWPRGLRRRSAATRLLRSWVRIPPQAWIFVCCECRVLSGRGLCDELITRPEESYRLWCVVVCDLETSRMRRPWPALGRSATQKKTKILPCTNNILLLHNGSHYYRLPVCIVTMLRVWRSRVRIPVATRNVSLLRNVQTMYKAHSSLLSNTYQGSCPA